MSSAILSADRTYRYVLTRVLDATNPLRACFIMLNPSTADADADDPTIRRCIGFAKNLGVGFLDVINLFAFRATDPRALVSSFGDPVGHENDRYTIAVAANADIIICAWGANGFASNRAIEVVELLHAMGLGLSCLRLTRDGYPAHPLYLPSHLQPIPFK